MVVVGVYGVDGSFWGDYCSGVQFFGLYVGQSVYWDCYWWFLVDVGGNGYLVGVVMSGFLCIGYF